MAQDNSFFAKSRSSGKNSRKSVICNSTIPNRKSSSRRCLKVITWFLILVFKMVSLLKIY